MSTDLNKILNEVQKDSSNIEKQLKAMFGKYSNFYQEANSQFNEERTASNSMTGLEDFYSMVQTIRRNRDVIGSLLRGINSLRPLNDFKVIEETLLAPKLPKKKKTPINPVMGA